MKRYRDLQGFIGGCHDGYCVIKKPQGMRTNGGCNCLQDMKLHERSRVGALLRYGQEMADHIEELEAKLVKAVAGLKQCEEEIDQYIWQEYPSDHPVHERYRKRDFSANPARLALAELKGQDDEDEDDE